MKPELVAQAIWIAAPILPGTREQAEAEVLYQLAKADDEELLRKFYELCKKTELDKDIAAENDVTFIRKAVINRIRVCKYVSPHYMHVEGTSFAVPIVSSVIAQMLEADPLLTPSMIREVLFSTAKRIEGLAAERQGFGVIQPQSVIKNFKRRSVYETSYITLHQRQTKDHRILCAQ